LLYKDPSPDSELIICDFGIARLTVDDNQVLTTVCGSPGYVAPEIMTHKGYGKPVDLWSIGVITYTILCGYQPFHAEDRAELLEEIKGAKFEFHERYWRGISEEAKAFIRALLNPNPQNRLTAVQALAHPWLEGVTASDHDLLENVRDNFNPKKAFRSAVEAVNAMRRISSKVESTSTSPSTSPPTAVAKNAAA